MSANSRHRKPIISWVDISWGLLVVMVVGLLLGLASRMVT
jgi:hypothetical protein